MLIVCAEVAVVEAELVGGLLACLSCREALGPWGHVADPVSRRPTIPNDSIRRGPR